VFTMPAAGCQQGGTDGGVWLLNSCEPGWYLHIIASNGLGWEHVSVHSCTGQALGKHKVRTPNWREMCQAKDYFWEDEDVVMQLHPKRSEYVNCHPHVLHLWRPTNAEIPTPPSILVGIKRGNQQ